MSMNPVPRQLDQASADLIEEYIRHGGKVTKLDAYKHSEELEYKNNFRRGRPKGASKDEV